MKAIALLLVLTMTAQTVIATSKPIQPRPGTHKSPETNIAWEFNLADFGAVGNGIDDDGPALQLALDALADAGGGALFVPAGRYAISTPVEKNFAGLAASVVIIGVESLTPAPPPNSPGEILTAGLDLVSELAPRTGGQNVAIKLSGLQTLLIKDITFIGTPNVATDALITLALTDIVDATVEHCEFYGLSSNEPDGSVLSSAHSNLKIKQSVFLGSSSNGAVNDSVVRNIKWKGFAVSETVFMDYGQRPELFGKLGGATPLSWIHLGDAAMLGSDEFRREAIFTDVFFDEGGLNGLTALTAQPSAVAPVDLLYISGLYMNVSSLNASGNYINGPQKVLIENSHYGLSTAADSAISLFGVGNAILDRVECNASANRISADANTGKLTVINSVYDSLNSAAASTRVLNTSSPEEDPVQYVRQQFNALLGHAPDPAAHFYWSNILLACNDDAACITNRQNELNAYLASSPSATFSISGKVTDESGADLPAVNISLAGSQSATRTTDATGKYTFANLPTSGVYTLIPSVSDHTFNPPSQTIVTPGGDQSANFVANLNLYQLSGRILRASGQGLENAIVTLSGAQVDALVTDASGSYNFIVNAGGDYQITVARANYEFNPPVASYQNVLDNQTRDFVGSLLNYTLSGRVTAAGEPLSDVKVSITGTQNTDVISDSAGNYSVSLLAEGSYTLTPSKQSYLFSPENIQVSNLSGNQTANFAGSLQALIEFETTSFIVTEGSRTIAINVSRSGDIERESAVTYVGCDGSADQKGDVIPVVGRLVFAPGEILKSFLVFITDDVHVEGDENLTLQLRDSENGVLGNDTAILNILDNDNSATNLNPVDDAQFFVRQHYRDFLNRQADAEGLEFWSNQILSCGNDAACLADRRMNVSAAFFLSIEFQETGFLVYRLYKASYADVPDHLDEFLLDTRTIGEGLIVNSPGWQELLEGNKTALIVDFVGRARFVEEYPLTLTPVEFIDLLNLKAGGTLTPEDWSAAVAEFGTATTSEDALARARVLRRVAESQLLTSRELNPAFVLMEYFGYLQRNPDDPPNTNLDGYNFWLNKLNEFNGDFRQAEMVKSFLVSGEYRERFGNP